MCMLNPANAINKATSTTTPLAAIASPAMATAAMNNKMGMSSGAQTVTRIGSIGRTTIACITPANSSTDVRGGDSVNVVSAAALAAVGVELDTVDDLMTDVIVKLENTATTSEMDDEDEEEEEAEPEVEVETADSMEQLAVNNNTLSGDEYNSFDLKLSSPMSWAFDSVKIENDEDFEDMLSSADQDNADVDAEDDDDLLTTAAATTKQAAVVASNNHNNKTKNNTTTNKRRIDIVDTTAIIRPRGSKRRALLANKQVAEAEAVDDLNLHQQQLLEQQQHLHHLQLQPNNQQRAVQIKLPTIPAIIRSVTPKMMDTKNTTAATSATNTVTGTTAGGAIIIEHQTANTSQQMLKNNDVKTTISDDKRYRILIQNQRTRKESLEHSEDMIYNADIEKPWVCRNCHRNYKWKNSLKCHLKNECGQPPRYFCSKLCGYATNVHSNLKRHLNTKCRDRLDDQHKNNSNNNNTNSTATYSIMLQNQE